MEHRMEYFPWRHSPEKGYTKRPSYFACDSNDLLTERNDRPYHQPSQPIQQTNRPSKNDETPMISNSWTCETRTVSHRVRRQTERQRHGLVCCVAGKKRKIRKKIKQNNDKHNGKCIAFEKFPHVWTFEIQILSFSIEIRILDIDFPLERITFRIIDWISRARSMTHFIAKSDGSDKDRNKRSAIWKNINFTFMQFILFRNASIDIDSRWPLLNVCAERREMKAPEKCWEKIRFNHPFRKRCLP